MITLKTTKGQPSDLTLQNTSKMAEVCYLIRQETLN